MKARLSEATASARRLEELHSRLRALLDSLDDAELHGPAAYVAMALDTMRRDHPELGQELSASR